MSKRNVSATPEERAFKRAVTKAIEKGEYPSPSAIFRALKRAPAKRAGSGTNLSGREVRWREEVLRSLGWVKASARRADGTPLPFTWRPPLRLRRDLLRGDPATELEAAAAGWAKGDPSHGLDLALPSTVFSAVTKALTRLGASVKSKDHRALAVAKAIRRSFS